MPKYPQPEAKNGSQKWLQKMVNEHPHIFDDALHNSDNRPSGTNVTWLSPRNDDGYAEYRDDAFLTRLGLTPSHHKPLNEFWPNRGPQWDALGKTEQGELLLVEAKAHIPEMKSPKSGANSAASIALIQASLQQTKKCFAPNSEVDWATYYYQYANRLAHLQWLRKVNGLSAYMVFVYFCGDKEMKGLETREEWEGAIKLMKSFMEIEENELSPFVVDLFVDVRELK